MSACDVHREENASSYDLNSKFMSLLSEGWLEEIDDLYRDLIVGFSYWHDASVLGQWGHFQP